MPICERNRSRRATSVRWRYPIRHPDTIITANRLDPINKFDVHAGEIRWGGGVIAVKERVGERHLVPEDAAVSYCGIDGDGNLMRSNS